MLEDLGRDVIAVFGLLVGVVGVVVTVAAWALAVKQIRLTQGAAEAARRATLKALGDTNRYFYRFLVANARRFFSEVRV